MNNVGKTFLHILIFSLASIEIYQLIVGLPSFFVFSQWDNQSSDHFLISSVHETTEKLLIGALKSPVANLLTWLVFIKLTLAIYPIAKECKTYRSA